VPAEKQAADLTPPVDGLTDWPWASNTQRVYGSSKRSQRDVQRNRLRAWYRWRRGASWNDSAGCEAFTRALKPRFKQLWYIDAFAGTGSRTVRVEARKGDLFDAPAPERVEQRRGSAPMLSTSNQGLIAWYSWIPSPRTAGHSAIWPISTRIERS